MAGEMNKKSFIKSGEGAIASYNWQDIADGTGYNVLYITGDSAGHKIVNKPFFSNEGNEIIFIPNVVGEHILNLDLTAFNSPRIAEGIAYLSFIDKVNIGVSGELTLSFEFFKVSGAVVTSISNVVSKNYTETAEAKRNLMTPTIERTKFGVGDILRLKIKVDVVTNAGWRVGTNTLGDADDQTIPKEDYPTVPFELNIPFKIEI